MRALQAIWTVICGIFIGLADFLGTVLGGVFGSPAAWQPPAWWQAFVSPVVAQGHRLADHIRANPARASLAATIALVLIAGSVLGWRWWQAQPKPETVAYSVSAPQRTCYECEQESDRVPKPLTVRFEKSVAPIALVGKDLPSEKSPLTMTPAQAGVWHWDDDKTLRFQPAADWPVGAKLKVDLSRKQLVAPQILLKEYAFEFDTVPFTVTLQDVQFDQDPVNPANKTGVATLRFSHPPDAASIESRLSLKYFDKLTDEKEVEREAPAYTLNFDAKKLKAYLRTASLAMPAKEGRVVLSGTAGMVSSLGGPATSSVLDATIKVPGRYALAINELGARIARDVDDAPVQLLTLALTHSSTEDEVKKHTQAWLLPLKNPDAKKQAEFEQRTENFDGQPYPWGNEQVGEALLKAATALPLTANALETEHAEVHSFSHRAEPGRWMAVRVSKGLKSFGGYELEKSSEQLLQVPDYPAELRLVGKGALLAMSGQKKLNVFTRDLPGIKVEVGRLLPGQLQHLITQSGGALDALSWNGYSFDESNVTESLGKVITLPQVARGQAQYTALDLAPFLAQGVETKRGVFFLRLRGFDPKTQNFIDAPINPEGEGSGYEASTADTRLIVITDLGLVVKRNKDQSREVFVQSLSGGAPMAGVTLQVIGKNGEAVLSRETDAQGHAQLPDLKGYRNERQPVLLLARKDGDQSFLPLDWRMSGLDLSRFDVGGVSQATEAGALSAFMFSDRGLYRPGELAHFGVIVRAAEFGKALPQSPLEYEITDPKGTRVWQGRRELPASGFDEVQFASRETSPTGTYTLTVYLPQKNTRLLLGSVDFSVREFQPDRLKLALTFSEQRAQGWVKPDALAANVDLQNLFGTPAQNRRVTAEMRLSPWFPAFAGFEDFQFTDPQAAKEGFSESLSDATTGEDGKAVLDLGLQRFAKATYRVALTMQGFEPDGGRGVTGEAAQVVSSLPYLLGWKADGDLGYVSRNAERSVALAAISPEAKRIAVSGLKLQRFERKFVSVLVRRDNGTYQYESRQKDALLTDVALNIAATGGNLKLDAGTPGSFFYLVVDAPGQVFARIPYTVAGAANLTRSLEKNAELQLTLSKKDYAPGEEIELSLLAPYAGAGLITIEREKVLSWQWFTSATTASVQKIRVPEGLEGSAYVHVVFLRDPASDETQMSPMSYGVAPFSVAIDARRATLTVEAQNKLKPGETLRLKVTASQPGKAVVYAVDEGILQVARYETPKPLEFFFQKRSLDVETLQILDLLLPEFRAMGLSKAPGGDADGALGKHLNPFRRKTDPPIAWWSGVVDVGPEPRELTWLVPESFNGTLRLMAVSVDAARIGSTEGKALVRGDFTLLPNAPLAVAPGDEFEVSTGVSNNLEAGAKDMPVQVTLVPSANLEVLGPVAQTLAIGPQREGVARYRVRAKDAPGGGALAFTAKAGSAGAKLTTTLSVRPATPYRVQLSAASIKAESSADIAVTRSLYPHFRTLEASVSPLPLSLANGLTAYLDSYPYACTEQLISMAVPALVLSDRPEFGAIKKGRNASFEALFTELATRQRSDGDYRLWPNGAGAEFVSIYAQHFLIEAAERGKAAPGDLLANGNGYLLQVARRDGDNLEQERNAAYAIYLLTRQGEVMAAEADALRGRLEKNWKGQWEQDATAAWLAAAYSRMQQKPLAEKLIARVKLSGAHSYDRYHSPMATDAELLYVLAKHFPDRLQAFGPVFVESLVKRLTSGEYHSLSAATSILALDAYATVAQGTAVKLRLAEVLKNNSTKALALPEGLFPKVPFSEAATKLRVGNPGKLPAYALVTESGFDRTPPTKAVSNGFEILREYTDRSGKPVTQVKLGDEVEVHVKFRAIGKPFIFNVAVVDLLPGGFEIVQPPPAPAEQVMQQAVPEEEQGEEDGESATEAEVEGDAQCGCDWVVWISGSALTYADYREDRAVLYVDLDERVGEVKYRLKAVAAGSFTIPPAYGEAMYDRSVFARSLPGRIEVVKP
ncbi:MAG: alpha-2-macroglobulin [Pseudomonadota bacterium]